MNYLIDAHEDMAFNMVGFQRDYSLSAESIRRKEENTDIPLRAGGETLLGYADYQRGRVALVFATLFCSPNKYKKMSTSLDDPAIVSYSTPAEGEACVYREMDAYRRLAEAHPEKFALITNRRAFRDLLKPWKMITPESNTIPSRMGLVMSIEGAEWLPEVNDVEKWWQEGVRLIGPVWGGGRFCGGTREPGAFTGEGYKLLQAMDACGFGLDVAHMTDKSVLQALDSYSGTVICSHGNLRRLIKDVQGERHLTDEAVRKLAERGGVIGLIPYNRFLDAGWKDTDPRSNIRLEKLVLHIDAICQLTGSADHVAFGTDFDGGIGWPAIPLELNTIGDMPLLEERILERGYTQEDVAGIFHGNWERILERILPQE